MKTPPILIFDEATSTLDSANERAIQAELQNVAQNKTTLVMDAGCILERGTHAALLALNGLYSEMKALQQSVE